MQDPAVLKSVSHVIDRQGRRAAVQISIEDWTAFLDYVEDLEDRALVKSAWARLLGLRRARSWIYPASGVSSGRTNPDSMSSGRRNTAWPRPTISA